MASKPLQGITERSGVYRGEDGNLYLPGTRRPNGTYRKPIRVKEGYIPQEEQPTYENAGVKWSKDKPDCPGLVMDEEPAAPPSNERNRKKKEARKRAAEKKEKAGDKDMSEVIHKLQETALEGVQTESAMDIAKRLKNLRKRLAQIDSLKQKIENGELTKPDPDQLKKVERRAEVVEEIQRLEKQL